MPDDKYKDGSSYASRVAGFLRPTFLGGASQKPQDSFETRIGISSKENVANQRKELKL